MPSLIRFLVVLLLLAGMVFGGMFALTKFVDPPSGEVTERVPTRDLLGS